MKHPDQPENSKVLKVAIIGAPNAGKSTLSNQLLGRKVFVFVFKKIFTLLNICLIAHLLKSVILS